MGLLAGLLPGQVLATWKKLASTCGFSVLDSLCLELSVETAETPAFINQIAGHGLL